MKRLRLKPLLIALAAVVLITGMVALPIVQEVRQEAKDRALIASVKQNDVAGVARLLDAGADADGCLTFTP